MLDGLNVTLNAEHEIHGTKKLGFALTKTTKRPVRIWTRGHRLIDTNLVHTSTTYSENIEDLYADMLGIHEQGVR